MINILCRLFQQKKKERNGGRKEEKERQKWRKTERKRKRVKEMEVTGNIDR
jgi:hypothetical protein